MAWAAGAGSQPNSDDDVRESFRQLGVPDEEIEDYIERTRGEDDQDETLELYPVYPANWQAAMVFLRVALHMERHPFTGQPLALKDGTVWRYIDHLKAKDPDLDEFELFDQVMTIGQAAAEAIRERFYPAD